MAFHRHFGHRILVGASGCEGEAALLSSVADSARGAWLASVGSCSVQTVLPSRPQPRLLPGLTGVRRFWGRQPGFGPSRWIYALVNGDGGSCGEEGWCLRGRCEATKFERETSSGPMRCVGRAALWSRCLRRGSPLVWPGDGLRDFLAKSHRSNGDACGCGCNFPRGECCILQHCLL